MTSGAESLVFVTPYFRRHGLAYFDVMLHALARDQHVRQEGSSQADLDQYELLAGKARLPRDIGKAVLLVPRSAQKRGWISQTPGTLKGGDKWSHLVESLRADVRLKPRAAVQRWFEDILDASKSADLSLEIARRLKPEGVSEQALWHVIHEFPLPDQLKWWRAASPWSRHDRVRIDPIGDESLEPDDPVGWTRAISEWIKRQPDGVRFLVNLHGTQSHNQLAWYYLAWRLPRLQRSTFCAFKTLDKKEDPRRFRRVRVETLSPHLFSRLGATLTPPEFVPSAERERVYKWLEFYRDLEDLFVIVLLGQRGTGKSSAVREVFQRKGSEREGSEREGSEREGSEREGSTFVEANCAQFENSTMAESQLFGHVEGAYTGAIKAQGGLFARADGGTLFLDEVHKLDRGVQAKLLTALQTDDQGRYRYTPLGAVDSSCAKFQLIVGSNLPEAELRTRLLEDFWDRVNQRKIKMPPFDKWTELEGGWDRVWKHMRFLRVVDPMSDQSVSSRLLRWLHTLDYPGNFRDLRRRVIRVADLIRGEQSGLLERSAEDDDPLWFAVLRREVESEEAARDEDTTEDTSEVTSRPLRKLPKVYRDLFDLNFEQDEALKPDELLKAYRQHLAELLVKQLGPAKSAALRRLEERGARMGRQKLDRWLAGR